MNPLQGGGIALLPPARGHIAHTHAHAALGASETAPISQSPPACAAPSCAPARTQTHVLRAPTVCMDPQVSSQTRSDSRVKASINPAPLP